ncbi:MAG: glycine oxidase ThiO [Myxococcaceae bacterium]
MQDVIVIGGGIMGCAVSFRLAQRGLSVTVLERSIPGAEASSAAAGMLAPQMEAKSPGPLLDLCLRSRALFGALADELKELTGIDVGYVRSGILDVALEENALHGLEAAVAWQRAHGLRAELLSTDAARELEPQLSPRAAGAAYFPDDHQVDNRLLVRALSMAAAKVGGRRQTGLVRGLRTQGDTASGVDLDGSALEAPSVVLAAGSWSSLVPGTRVEPSVVRPARGQMLQFQTRLPLLTRILASNRGYLVPRADGRLIAGSTLEHVGFEKQVTGDGLAKILSMALELCPALAQAPVDSFWAGLRPYTEDHLPLLGEGPLRGLYLATGHFRNGILLAPITAKLTAELVAGEKPTVNLQPFRFDRFGAARSPM